MIARTAPMGWNSWNTFGSNINEELIRQMADVMVEKGYRDAGYEYLVIDDCWSLKQRDENGLLVADPEKFPHGMKAVADYVHSKGLKFGMYSCAGVRTCAGYPSSFDHEFVDAQTFADWGVDFLKYDFCNFPANGDCKMRYQTMSMALKATGREILFSACNWGREDPWHWMRSIGAHMYRSTGDIMDNFVSFTDIVKSQLPNFCDSGNFCFNSVRAYTFACMEKLMNAGLDLAFAARRLFLTKSRAHIAALGKAIGSMVYFADGQATCMHLSAQDKADCGAQDADLGGIVNYALYMDGVRMCFRADEDAQGNGKYSLRALPGEDVSDIARSFGGGGHALASGCTIAGPYADSSRAMMNAMEKKLLK